jgi:hypothetical protein
MSEYQFLCTEIQKQIDSKAQFIAAGNVQSFDEYQRVTGVIRGLSLAIDLIKDREQTMEENDE